MLAYARAFLLANWKQLLATALSAADGYMLLKHPEWRPYEGIAAAALGTWGIHLEPVVYRPEKLAARNGAGQ